MKQFKRVIETVFLALVFFGLIAPISVLCRLLGHDPLNLKLDSLKKSYWVGHSRTSEASENFHTQFVQK